MGCVYSNASSKNQFQSDEQLEDAQPSRCRIFNVCNVDDQGNEIQNGRIEITDTELILHLRDRDPVVWPLRFLRKYGHDNNLFSFECGRRCPTGPGIYAFKCSNAMHLFQTLVDVINNATLTSSATALNVGAASNAQNSHVIPLQNSGSSSHSPTNNMVHEYQNLAPFGDNGTLRSTGGTGVDANFRSHSAIGNDHHTYLNSSNNNVIGIKSQPNYYTSKPLSFNSNSHFEGSRNSLSSGPRSAGLVNNFDSSTLPMRSPNSSICNGTQDDTCLGRRKNSEYENTSSYVNTYNNVEPMRSRMAGSEDFCFVNIDPDSRREKIAFHGSKARSTRTTPEPYIQLDLQKADESKSQPNKSTSAVALNGQNEPTKRNGGDSGSSCSSNASSSQKNDNTTTTANNPSTTTTATNTGKSDNRNSSKVDPSISYTQIDFARTMALSNSAASHRKL